MRIQSQACMQQTKNIQNRDYVAAEANEVGVG